MNIVLIGYRGCGKTTVGRLLAGRFDLPFLDTDDLVCEQAFGGASIAQIWQEHGEPAFRAAECRVVASVMARDGQIVGLGGGTLMQGPARQAVEDAKAFCVYLACPAAVLAERIASDDRTAATRPNLTAHGGGLEEVRAMLAEREPVYRAVADHAIEAGSMTPEQIADAIAERADGR